MQRRQLLHTLGMGLGVSLLPHAAQAQPAQLPCFILCVPGGRGWLTRLNTQVRAFGHGFRVDTEYSADEADSRMARAFQASAHRAEPSSAKPTSKPSPATKRWAMCCRRSSRPATP